jgi:hypothetical protein
VEALYRCQSSRRECAKSAVCAIWTQISGHEVTAEPRIISRERKGGVERQKGLKKYLLRNENEGHEVDHILRIFRTSKVVTASMTVRAC